MPAVGRQTFILWIRYVLYHEPGEIPWAILAVFAVLDLSLGVHNKGTRKGLALDMAQTQLSHPLWT